MAIDPNERLNSAKTRLSAYYQAELAVLTGQEYTIAGRTLRRADLKTIRAAITDLETLVYELDAAASGKGRRKMIGVIPRDW